MSTKTKKDAQHTPWIVELNEAANNFFVGSPHGPTVALISSTAIGHIEANARLIAAGPDLLQWAKEVLDVLNDGPADRECPLSGRHKMACDCVGHRQLRAAIAKAEGRDP